MHEAFFKESQKSPIPSNSLFESKQLDTPKLQPSNHGLDTGIVELAAVVGSRKDRHNLPAREELVAVLLKGRSWEFPTIRGTLFWVLIVRILFFKGTILRSPIFGNSELVRAHICQSTTPQDLHCSCWLLYVSKKKLNLQVLVNLTPIHGTFRGWKQQCTFLGLGLRVFGFSLSM